MLPPSPTQRKRAVAWFRSRVPMSDAAWRRMGQQNQLHGFRVSGVSSAQAIGSVLRGIDQAIAKGLPFAEFQKKAGPALLREWGGSVKNPSARMKTIFINATSTALNQGRWEQIHRPEALRRRPMLAFVAVDDGKTTIICRRCRQVVLPASHPFWKSHWPPLHHRCRSGVRALTVAQARARGITTRAPGIAAQEGFGISPAKAWTPDERRIHPLLRRDWRRRLKAYEKRPLKRAA